MLFWMLFGSTFAVMLTGTGSSLCKGIGRVEIETIYILLSLILNVILKVVLVLSLGPIGTVISSALSWAIASVVFAVLLHRSIHLLPVEATRRVIPAMASVAILVALARLASFYLPPGPSRLNALISGAGFGAALMVGYCLLAVALGVITPRHVHDAWRWVRTGLAGFAS